MPTNPHLEKSIQHWERLASGDRLPDEQFGSDNCALCKEYYNQFQISPCDGCPVKLKTGRDNCNGSPFEIIRKMDVDWFKNSYEDIEDMNALMDTQEFKEAAKLELEFLKSLREEKPKV